MARIRLTTPSTESDRLLEVSLDCVEFCAPTRISTVRRDVQYATIVHNADGTLGLQIIFKPTAAPVVSRAPEKRRRRKAKPCTPPSP